LNRNNTSGLGRSLKSFRLKTILVVLGILVFWLAIGVKLVVDYQTDIIIGEVDRDSRFLALSVLEDLESAAMRGEEHNVPDTLSRTTLYESVYCVCLAGNDKTVKASTHKELIGMHSNELGAVSDLDKCKGCSINKLGSGLDEGPFYSQTIRVDNKQSCRTCHSDDGDVLGWLTVSVSVKRIMGDIESMRKNMVIGGVLLAIMLSVSLSVFLTRSVNRPIERLADTMKSAETDLSVRFDLEHDRELSPLAKGFNALVSNLQSAREELKGDYHTELGWYQQELIDTNEELEESNRKLDEKLRKLATLMDVGRIINTCRKPDDLMVLVLESAMSQLDGDRGSIMHFEKGIGGLIVSRGMGLSPEYRRRNRFRLGEGIAGWVAENKEALIANDVSADERYLPGESGSGAARLMSVPLLSSNGDLLSVLNIERTNEHPEFSISDLEYMLAITGNASVAIENAELLQNIQKSYYDTISALALTVEAKDPYTLGHSKRVTQYSIAMAEELGMTEEETRVLQYGATLHDIGKIAIPESILNKRGKLTDEEFREIMTHAERGEAIIASVDFLEPTRKIIRNHQEFYDGKGYPDGLKGDEIPLNVAIVAVADFYDALTSDRPYRSAFSHERTIEMMKEQSGKKLNPEVVEAFLRIFDEPDMG